MGIRIWPFCSHIALQFSKNQTHFTMKLIDKLDKNCCVLTLAMQSLQHPPLLSRFVPVLSSQQHKLLRVKPETSYAFVAAQHCMRSPIQSPHNTQTRPMYLVAALASQPEMRSLRSTRVLGVHYYLNTPLCLNSPFRFCTSSQCTY